MEMHSSGGECAFSSIFLGLVKHNLFTLFSFDFFSRGKNDHSIPIKGGGHPWNRTSLGIHPGEEGHFPLPNVPLGFFTLNTVAPKYPKRTTVVIITFWLDILLFSLLGSSTYNNKNSRVYFNIYLFYICEIPFFSLLTHCALLPSAEVTLTKLRNAVGFKWQKMRFIFD